MGVLGDLLGLRQPLVLCLHSVVGEGSDDFASGMSITDRFLDDMIVDLRRRKIDIVSLSDALQRLDRGTRAPFVSLTFDDGYRDCFNRAFPILKRHGAPFTVFLTTGLVDGDVPMWWHVVEDMIESNDILRWVDQRIDIQSPRQKKQTFLQLKERFRVGGVEDTKLLLERLVTDNRAPRTNDGYRHALTWAMVREMSASGLADFGCHTMSHPLLSRLAPDALEREIFGARDSLRRGAMIEASYFAYPFGQPKEVGPLAAHIVEKAGFKAAFTTIPNVLSPDAMRFRYDLSRVMLTKKAQATAVVRAYMSGIPAILKRSLRGANRLAGKPLADIAADTPIFSLVIATVGRVDEIVRCLESLCVQTLPHFEVIIVDQNSDDCLNALVSRFSRHLQIRHLRAARGLSKARNLGIAHARGTFVGFPDDDCWYPPDLLAELYSRLLAEPRLAALTVRCTDGFGQMAAGRHGERAGDVTRRNVWERGVGATMFARRKALSELGGFDENLGLGAPTPFQSGEETDLLLRGLSHGYLIRYDPSLEVFHPLEDLDSPGATLKSWSYGLGMGRVLRLRRYRLPSVLGHVAAPVLGALIASTTNRPVLARIRLARALARFQGWRWSCARKFDLSPPAWVTGRGCAPMGALKT